MKFFISLMLICPSFGVSIAHGQESARAPIVIISLGARSWAQNLAHILQRNFGIPLSLVELRSGEKNCVPINRAIIQFCMKEEGDMELTQWRRQEWERNYAWAMEKTVGAPVETTASLNQKQLATNVSEDSGGHNEKQN